MEDIHGKTHGRIVPAPGGCTGHPSTVCPTRLLQHGVSAKPYLQPPMNRGDSLIGLNGGRSLFLILSNILEYS